MRGNMNCFLTWEVIPDVSGDIVTVNPMTIADREQESICLLVETLLHDVVILVSLRPLRVTPGFAL